MLISGIRRKVELFLQLFEAGTGQAGARGKATADPPTPRLRRDRLRGFPAFARDGLRRGEHGWDQRTVKRVGPCPRSGGLQTAVGLGAVWKAPLLGSQARGLSKNNCSGFAVYKERRFTNRRGKAGGLESAPPW